jgi:hypothetical protein
MVESGDFYRNIKYDMLVEVISVDDVYIIVALGGPKVQKEMRLILHQNTDTFTRDFAKLSSLELELL